MNQNKPHIEDNPKYNVTILQHIFKHIPKQNNMLQSMEINAVPHPPLVSSQATPSADFFGVWTGATPSADFFGVWTRQRHQESSRSQSINSAVQYSTNLLGSDQRNNSEVSTDFISTANG
jgi:hypothetical protein